MGVNKHNYFAMGKGALFQGENLYKGKEKWGTFTLYPLTLTQLLHLLIYTPLPLQNVTYFG
jgi:hypothetical protein